MKSEILKRGDKVLITHDLIDHLIRVGNPGVVVNRIWEVGKTATIEKLSDYSTVRIVRGVWSVWIDNNIAESMRIDYLKQTGK